MGKEKVTDKGIVRDWVSLEVEPGLDSKCPRAAWRRERGHLLTIYRAHRVRLPHTTHLCTSFSHKPQRSDRLVFFMPGLCLKNLGHSFKLVILSSTPTPISTSNLLYPRILPESGLLPQTPNPRLGLSLNISFQDSCSGLLSGLPPIVPPFLMVLHC